MNSKRDRTVMTRRHFVSSAAAGTAVTVVPAHVLGRRMGESPNEKLNIAGVGVAGMGAGNLARVESENIVALCDVDEKYAAHVFKKYPHAKVWPDYRKMLEQQRDIDAVIVATPDHLHAVVTKTAMELGKHVYTQKPLTRTVEEARALRAAARETGVATQMGNQGHAKGAVRRLREWMEAGVIGTVREVHCWTKSAAGMWPQGIRRPKTAPAVPSHLDWDLWLGPAPERPYHPIYHPNRWRGWWDFGGGALGDMGCHIFDAPFYALQLEAPQYVSASYTRLDSRKGSYTMGQGFNVNMEINGETFPVQTSCSGPDAETAPLSCVIRYEFPARQGQPPLSLTWWDGGLAPPLLAALGHTAPGRGAHSAHGSLFVGEKGSISCGPHSQNMLLRPESLRQEHDPPPQKYPRINVSHEQDWIRACKGGPAACSNFEYAAALTELVLLGNVALRTGKQIEWDAEAMKATNAPEADRYLDANYRKGWRL